MNQDPGAEDRFKVINEAYAVLGDPERRAQYDQFGMLPLTIWAPARFGGFGGFGFEDLGDIFSEFFGGGFGTRQSHRPQREPICGMKWWYLLQAAFGLETDLTIPVPKSASTAMATRQNQALPS